MSDAATIDISDAVRSLAVVCGYEESAARSLDIYKGSNDVPVEETEEYLLGVLGELGALRQNSIYVSTPITTGRSYVDRNKTKFQDDCLCGDESPREQNRRHAAAVAEVTRRYFYPRLVLNPTPLIDIPGWGQGNYHSFWVDVISRFASTVLFVDGWQYSAGCSVEFVATVKLGLNAIDERFDPLPYRSGFLDLQEAISVMGSETRTSVVLQNSLNSLRPILDEREAV